MYRRGFTLIELLITISILSILATIGFSIYFGVLPKARDSKRMNDLNKLATALEIYFQKNNGNYIQGSGTGCNDPDTTAFYTVMDDPDLKYLEEGTAPRDPKTKNPYCYVSVNNGQSYRLFAILENCSSSNLPGTCSTDSYNFSITSDDLILAPPP